MPNYLFGYLNNLPIGDQDQTLPNTQLPEPANVLHFWFDELDPKQHFSKNADLDRQIVERFGALHAMLAADEAAADSQWRTSTDGRVANVIVLDQFSRQIYRDDARAWAYDAGALHLAKELIADGTNTTLSVAQRRFVYMPFMHSENLSDQERSVELFTALGDKSNLRFAIAHRDVIARFGRFPYRNELLGRISTPEEIYYVEQHGSF